MRNTTSRDVIQSGLRDLSDARVLVIDDESIIVEAIEAILECDVVGATTAQCGRQSMFELGPFDLVFVDKNLPDGSGLDIVRELKQAIPDQEFIILTGYPSMESAIEAVEAGAFDYIPKPFEVSTLIFKVRNAVAKTRQTRNEQRLLTELAESESRHRALFEASSDAIIMFDAASGKVGAANAAAQSMFGYGGDSLLGLSRSDLSIADCQTKTPPPSLENAIVCQARRRDGSSFPVEISRGATIFDGQHAYVDVIRDRSERVRMEAEREAVSQRLRKSEKMEALGQLAAGIAHDFNNLLVVFMGAVHEIKYYVEDNENLIDEDFQLACADLETATKSAHNLTRQLLGFGRRQLPSLETLDVELVIRSIATLLRRTLTARIAIEVDVDESVPPLIMDRGQVEQILTNLALNARDAMPTGGVLTIAASATTDKQGQPLLVLRIKDTGSGMDPTTVERIFEPFFTTKDSERGTGLGLATVLGIVQSNQGEIYVETAIGVGTTFEVHLPLGSGAPEQEAELAHHPSLQRGGERILVVEDHQQVRTFIDRILTKAGYLATCVDDGEAALALLKDDPSSFDLLLTDMGLPTMQGNELAKHISSTSDTKVLCMSAYARTEESAEDADFPFLAKPFTRDVLLERIRNVLAQATRGAA